MRQDQRTVPLDVTTFHELRHQDQISLELDEALESLDESYRIALTLYYVNGLTTREISEFLHESEGTIKSRISRAKQYLKNNYYVEEAQLL